MPLKFWRLGFGSPHAALAVAWAATGHRPLPAPGWELVTSVTGSLTPMAVIVRGANAPSGRAGRRVPLLVAGVSLGLAFAVLPAGGVPVQLIALAASMPASLLVAVAIAFDVKFKISLTVSSAQ